MATLLPGVEFSTRSPYPTRRRLHRAGAAVALASDCNPGTCYSSSMPFMIAFAVREMGFTPAQALCAATAGGARALRRTDIGRIVVGARADLAVLDAPSFLHLCYRPGVPLVRALELKPALRRLVLEDSNISQQRRPDGGDGGVAKPEMDLIEVPAD